MLSSIYQEKQIKLRSLLEITNKVNFKVSHLEKVEVVHLFLHSIGNFSFYDFIFDKYLSNWLILFVENIHLARKTPMMETFHLHIYHCLAETHRLDNIIFCKVNLLTIFETDELQFQRSFFFSQWKYKGLFPCKIFSLRGWLTIALLVVISQSTISRYFLIYVFKLGLPKCYN
jgi:hypothetical protein